MHRKKIKYPVSIIALYAGITLFATFLPAQRACGQEDEPLYPALLSTAYEAGTVAVRFEPLLKDDITYRIYRSSSPLTSAPALERAILVQEVSADMLPYFDAPDTDGTFYYAVTAVLSGNELVHLVPYQNVNMSPVDYAPFPAPVEHIEISEIGPDLMSVRFSPVQKGHRYRLYMDNERIDDIADRSPDAETGDADGFFRIRVKESKQYYVAVTSINRLGVENRKISAGKNASVRPFVLSERKLKAPVQKVKRPTSAELIDRAIRSYFYKAKYRAALTAFLGILSRERLTPAEKATVHFYAGQSDFYLRNYRSAVRHFVLSKEDGRLTAKADAWIERCLELID